MTTLPRPKICSAPAKWVRFWRYKFSFWFQLAIAGFQVILGASVQRTHAKIVWMKAISKIDFAGIYGLLNDLLW